MKDYGSLSDFPRARSYSFIFYRIDRMRSGGRPELGIDFEGRVRFSGEASGG
jgi:hypothetical protein